MRRARDPSLILAFLVSVGLTACGSDAGAEFGGGGPLPGGDPGDADQANEIFELERARGISILEVEINQGTRVSIGSGGKWLDIPERTGPLIASRDSLMRVHYTVDPDWVPREIEAQLSLEFPDGSGMFFVDTRWIESGSNPNDLYEGPFFFELLSGAGQTLAGAQYRVELWEVLDGGGERFSVGEWANPAEGPELVGFEPVPMQIKTMLVPITYDGVTAALDDATRELVLNNLYEQNPVTEILWGVHAPVSYPGQLYDLAELLPVLATLRADEGAAPNVYYHAFIDIGSQSLAGALGISGIASELKTDSGNRVSATVLWAPDPSIAADTYTHETGHAQGLLHVDCPTNSSTPGVDPAYPHEDGHIDDWGFGLRRFTIFDPDEAFDYMSYCGPSWVSGWTWDKTYARIETLTSWDFEGSVAESDPTEQQLLVGAIYRDGRRQWWTMPGAVDPERVSELDRFEFEVEGEIIAVTGATSVLSDGQTRWVEVALPAEIDSIDSIEYARGDLSSVELTGLRLGAGQAPRSDWRPEFTVFRP